MPVKDTLLEILVCPATRRPLSRMAPEDLADLNRRIEAGEVENRAGRRLDQPLSEALVREGDDLAYPVEDDIPVLLSEEGIPLSREG